MKKLTYLILINILFSCQQDYPDLKGHWHIIRTPATERIGNFDHLPMDILSDTVGIINKNVLYEFEEEGRIDHKKGLFLFPGECHVAEFRFKLIRDTLMMNQLQYDKEDDVTFKGIRCNEHCCNKQIEYFTFQELNIDLPIVQDTSSYRTLDKSYPVVIPLIFGVPKPKYQQEHGQHYQFMIKDRWAQLNQIDSIDSEVYQTYMPDWHRYLIYVIYADKNTPIQMIANVLNEYKKIGRSRFIIVLRETSLYSELKIWYKKIQPQDISKADLKNQLTVETWLKQ